MSSVFSNIEAALKQGPISHKTKLVHRVPRKLAPNHDVSTPEHDIPYTGKERHDEFWDIIQKRTAGKNNDEEKEKKPTSEEKKK